MCRVCASCPCYICLIHIYFQEVVFLSFVLKCVVVEVLCTFVWKEDFSHNFIIELTVKIQIHFSLLAFLKGESCEVFCSQCEF